MKGGLQIASILVLIVNYILSSTSLWVVAFNISKGAAFLCVLVTAIIGACTIFIENHILQVLALIIQAIIGVMLMVRFFLSKQTCRHSASATKPLFNGKPTGPVRKNTGLVNNN